MGYIVLGRRKGEPLHCQPDGVLLIHLRTNERNQPGGWSRQNGVFVNKSLPQNTFNSVSGIMDWCLPKPCFTIGT